MLAQPARHVPRDPGVTRPVPHVQEEGPLRFEDAPHFQSDLFDPIEIFPSGPVIIVGPVPDTDVVWWRRHDDANRGGTQELLHPLDAVGEIQSDGRRLYGDVGVAAHG